MTEIIIDLDARQLADRLTALELHSTSELARLERERDEAREKTERYRIEANAIMMQRDEWAAMCGRYKQERNEAQDKYATEATEHMLAVNKLCGERDEALSQIAQAECRAERYCQERDELIEENKKLNKEVDDLIRQRPLLIEDFKRERDEARDAILGWENKWKCAVDMAARAELERDEALKCAKEYYVEFIRNASSDNKVSKPNPLKPFYKY